MAVSKEQARWELSEATGLSSLLYHYLFSWLYSARNLRNKAACTPYLRVRKLLLRRSGVEMDDPGYYHFGITVVGTARRPVPLRIGKRVGIGPHVTFLTSSMPSYSRLKDHPALASAVVVKGRIVVEDDVWIGAGVTVMPNVTIGRGALIGAGAVITRDVPPLSLVTGVPGRVVRTFPEFE